MLARSIVYAWIAATLTCIRCVAQIAEPILTKAAVPNPAGTVSVKLDFVSPLGGTGVSSQALPESRIEIGLGRGFETDLQTGLLRISKADGSSVLAGGQFSMALKYLLAGSSSGKYAVSVSLGVSKYRLETLPSSETKRNSCPWCLPNGVLLPGIVFRSNVGWNTTVSGTTGRFANFQHAHAVAWFASRHFTPVVEFAGSTKYA